MDWPVLDRESYPERKEPTGYPLRAIGGIDEVRTR